jgi:hypothetical protein
MKKIFKYSKSRITLSLLGVIMIGLFSCKREIVKPELLSNYEGNNYGEIFTAFWSGMNSNYLFWDQESTNWDSVYRAYKPKFDSLDAQGYTDTTLNFGRAEIIVLRIAYTNRISVSYRNY